MIWGIPFCVPVGHKSQYISKLSFRVREMCVLRVGESSAGNYNKRFSLIILFTCYEQ